MATDGTKWSRVSIAPPRKINVQKFSESRAPELESLHSIVSSRLNDDFQSWRNKRRRTTAYDNQNSKKRHRKPKLGVSHESNVLNLDNDQKKVPRHIRRRLEFKKNPEFGFCTSGDGTKRLRTHVWHAKRFTMTKLWGFHLPLGLQGRGRGSRALLKCFKHGVLIHDASYYTTAQLEGTEDSLLRILEMVLVPSQATRSEDVSRSIRSGAIYGSAMLHHIGAPISQSIAPVSFMWRPNQQSREERSNDDTAAGSQEPYELKSCSSFCQLWVWIHASAFDEGYDVLKLACQKEMSERGITIRCSSLEDRLARLEIIGSRAFQLLQKTLYPVNSVLENSVQFNRSSVINADDASLSKRFSVLENEECIPSRSILSLNVKDPRILTDGRIANVSESAATDILDIPKVQIEENICSENKYLWNASSGLNPPVEDNVVCTERHRTNMNFFCLEDPKPGALMIPNIEQCSRSCPILLLRNNIEHGSTLGNKDGFCLTGLWSLALDLSITITSLPAWVLALRWSIILPLSWVKVFWIAFVSKGARGIGLREKHWIACETGLPCFPSDFPDCSANSSFMATEVAASYQKDDRRPPAIRPLKVPILPPWDSVRVSLAKGPIRLQDTVDMVNGYSMTATRCSKREMSSSGRHGSSLFVARTSNMLSYFLNEIHGGHLLLFPNRKASITELTKDEGKFGKQQGIDQIIYNKLCFLRVILRAYKEGVFEDGAVICAPSVTDITMCTSRSENTKSGLKMPECSVGSYFKEGSTGNWELQIPEDPVRQCYRWPIGFITTGFVRGSKKPIAKGFCEAVLLASIREEQWKEMPKKRRKEIYVLVRNLRSSAYRLALATIVLEQQEQDVEFM